MSLTRPTRFPRLPEVNSRTIAPARSLFASLLVVVLLAGVAAGQSGLRATHTIGRTTETHVEVTGTVANDTRADAVDVSVTIEAVGEKGKRLARGISYVTSRLPPGMTASFTAKVPVVAGVTGYRSSVSARFVLGVEGP